MSLKTDESDELDPKEQEFLAHQRTEFLVQNIKSALLVSFINSLLIWAVFRFQLGLPGISLWLALGALVNGFRGYLAVSLPASSTTFSRKRWQVFTVFTFLSGFLWAYPIFMIPPGTDPIYAHLIVFIIAGMTAAASHSYSTHPMLVVAYVPPALLVLSVYYFRTTSSVAPFITSFLALYFFSLISVTRSVSRTFRLAIRNEWKAEQRRAELFESEEELRLQILAKEQSETAKARQIEKIRSLNNALDELYQRHSFRQSALQEFITDCLSTVSEKLEIGRVSLWCYTEDREAISCKALYLRSEAALAPTQAVLHSTDFPVYFSHLRENRVIVAPRAETDPQTAEFRNSYFRPNDIKSLLDAPIQSHEGVNGVICCESVGEYRDWQADEIGFLAAVAQLISIRMFTEESEVLNEELKKALATAQEADRAKADFMATMNHELRTPMNGVLGAAAILEQSDLGEKESSLAHAIVQSGGSLMALLNDMLDFSKFEAGRIDLESVAFSPAALIEEVRTTHYYTAVEKGLSFECVLDLPPDLQLRGDPHRLTQILHNLVSNAVKFTPQGTVRIEASHTEENGLQLSVTDTGIGIAEDRLEKIFQPFVQADSSTTRKYGGTGLGLSIVDKLVRAMNGNISIHSIVNDGTIISFNLPLPVTGQGHAGGDDAFRTEISGPDPLSGANILVVDDNSTNLLVLRAFLEKAHATVTTCTDGRAAFELCQSTIYDAVLMDIHMPVMDGVEAMQMVRSDAGSLNKSAPIIAVTADAMPEQIRKYLDLGFDDHISKPVRPAQILETLGKALADRKTAPLLSANQ